MGFLPEIRKILRMLPTKRQTLFFSATMPHPIRQLAGEMLHNPVSIERERQGGPPTGITQAVYPVAQELKSSLLVALLRRGDIKQALVFTRTKHRANRLADYLAREGVKVDRIHGNRSQGQRTAALAAFKAGRVPVLVATDIAARGIDVAGVSHVINFDVPNTPEAYTHRIGRTGRAEREGVACTFVTGEDRDWVRATERMIGAPIPRRNVEGFDIGSTATLEVRVAAPAVIRAAPAADGAQRNKRRPSAARGRRRRRVA
jgi:ATP-dependent RNA helicase RhlE